MNWKRLRYSAGFTAVLWFCVGLIFGIIKLIEYVFRGHPDLAAWVCLGLFYTLMFGVFGWMISGIKSRPTFRRKGWRTSNRKKETDDESEAPGWRRM